MFLLLREDPPGTNLQFTPADLQQYLFLTFVIFSICVHFKLNKETYLTMFYLVGYSYSSRFLQLLLDLIHLICLCIIYNQI